MSFTATIENNMIKLPAGVNLPDGTEVRIEPLEAGREPTFGESIKEFIGIVKDGPGDRADNHDHYLYGTPKRVP